jgi:hypothetical protein
MHQVTKYLLDATLWLLSNIIHADNNSNCFRS